MQITINESNIVVELGKITYDLSFKEVLQFMIDNLDSEWKIIAKSLKNADNNIIYITLMANDLKVKEAITLAFKKANYDK